MSTILVKERDWEEAESVRSGPRVVRTVRRYKYPTDDYNDLDEEVNRIIIRDRPAPPRHHSPPETTEDRIEIRRYDREVDRDSRDWDTRSHRSHRTHHSHAPSHHTHHGDDVDEIRITERRETSGPPGHREVREDLQVTERHIERDDRDWDTRSHRSHRTHHSHAPSHHTHHGDDMDEIRITERRETSGPPGHREVREDLQVTERHVERARSRSRSRSSSPTTRTSTRIVINKAEEDIVTRSPPRSPYTVEKYSKSTEYFSRPEPMPIIIRSEAAPAPQPIIIREREREPASPREIVIRQEIIQPQPEPRYQIVERQVDDRQVARRERNEEDDYYYERHVRRERPGRGRRDDYYEEHDRKRRKSRKRDERDFYSDDDVEYHRTVREYSRSPSRHRRHLLEGALGGAVAGEVIRHQRKQAGEKPGSHLAAVGGMGALGALGAEALSRVKEWDRERNFGADRSRSKSRHRGRSVTRGELLAGVAAVAAVGGAALLASRNKNAATTTTTTRVVEETPRRSRSRRRRGSTTHIEEEVIEEDIKHDKKHRNNRVAQAGVVGASIAALHGARSRSRHRSRSQSKVREGIPIVAAGLGTAAVASLYERKKAKKEERAVSRSRSRSRSATHRSRSGRRHSAALVEYGDEPIAVEERRHHRHGSRSTSRGRLFNRDRSRSHSHGRHSSRSKSRSRSRSRLGTALAGAAVGAAGVAALDRQRQREQRRAERERRRRAAADGRNPNDTASYTGTTESNSYYPSSHEFPPPPTAAYPPVSPGYAEQGYGPPPAAAGAPRAYNPADYGPTTGPTLPPEDSRYHSQTERYPRDDRHGGPENVSEPIAAPRSAEPVNNVSYGQGDVTPRGPSPARPVGPESHISSRSGKTVQFADDPPQSFSDSELERPSSRHSGGERRRRRSGRRASSPASDDSTETIEMPERFDEHGRPRVRQDSVADAVENFLRGNSSAGSRFNNVVDGLLGGAGGAGGAGGRHRRRSSDNYVRRDRRDWDSGNHRD